MIDCTVQNHFILELPSAPELIGPAVDLPIQIAAGMELLSGTELHRVSIAVQEALNNALYRGNLELTPEQWRDQQPFDDNSLAMPPAVAQRLQNEPFKDRKIRYDVLLTTEHIRFIITDQGPGFDVCDVPSKNDPRSLEEGHGRGLVLIHSMMDEVRFNPAGNQITMLKRCSRPAAAG